MFKVVISVPPSGHTFSPFIGSWSDEEVKYSCLMWTADAFVQCGLDKIHIITTVYLCTIL